MEGDNGKEEQVDYKKAYSKLNEWTKKNIFTVIGIIIILLVVWYDVGTVQVQKANIVKECNLHWEKQIKNACPILAENNYQYNMSMPKISELY